MTFFLIRPMPKQQRKNLNKGPVVKRNGPSRTYVMRLISVLRHATRSMIGPMSLLIQQDYGKDPYLILISCLLSLRSRDTVTYPLAKKLFQRARTPSQVLAIPIPELEQLLRPIGFFRQKARLLHDVSRTLIERFGGIVPDTESDLLSIKGVGRKTAALVLGVAFGKPAICVDTHVHRLANALGLVATRTPEETEYALQKIVPKRYWIELNALLVLWGQNISRSQQVPLLQELLQTKKH